MRIGIGYDSHRFCEGDGVCVGGVRIDFDRGVSAHSDGDVLLHALCDALLGAVSLGDIGQHFPDTDPKYRDVSSLILLQSVVRLVRQSGYGIVNVDGTVIVEAPKLKPHIVSIRQRIADSMAVSMDCVSVKATTNEGMGFIGRQEGLAAQVVVLLKLLDRP